LRSVYIRLHPFHSVFMLILWFSVLSLFPCLAAGRQSVSGLAGEDAGAPRVPLR
jgi:hypothetical protein